jgi:XTP/dITP diphosphohydrolase
MIAKLLVGSANPTKSVHYKKYFADMPIKIISAADLGITDEPEETGETFEDNAILKAKYYFEKSGGLPTLADDAGFEIPALNNFPGVKSRRFAGHEMGDEEIIAAILEAMKDLKGEARKARMRISCALMLSPVQIHVASASTEGHVPETPSPKREPHFPYRSLLFVDSVNAWLGDIGPENKDIMDHRGVAVAELKKYLE